MRKAVVSVAALVGLLGWGVLALGEDKKGKGKPAPDKKKSDPKLADLLAEAQKNSSDLRVAEARLLLARAELDRARKQVLQQVATLYQELEGAKALARVYEREFKRISQLREDQGLISDADYQIARKQMIRSKVEVATLEARMAALLGRSPLKKTEKGLARLRELAAEKLYRADQELIYAALREQLAARRIVKGSVADKLRKALDAKLKPKFDNSPLGDVLDFLEMRVPGLSFRILGKDTKGVTLRDLAIDLRLKTEVPVGAVIQAIQDAHPDLRFAVREYGVLVTVKDRLPPDAVLLYDFWKHGGKDKDAVVNAGKNPRRPVKNNPPRKNVRGTVKAVDRENLLVTITIGSDAGLKKGHTLEVFRLGANNKSSVYLGRIVILEVKAKAAVAKRLGQRKLPVKPGDQVASKLTGN
jgi:hypothetical protein